MTQPKANVEGVDEKTRLLTSSEVGEFLQISSARLSRLVKANLIPHIRLPGVEIRFIETDLLGWIERNKQPGKDAAPPATLSLG